MRRKFNPQLNLFTIMARNQIAQELQQISQVLDATPQVLELAYQDLVRSSLPTTGREGMTAEQVLRCAILKQYRQLTYEELAFHLEDSSSFRGFSRLEMGQYPGKSILQQNIKALREETWEALHREIIGYAKQEKIESGRKVRIDATAVETDIHHPTDSTLLADGIRIITRWLAEGKELTPAPRYQFSDHRRVVKKRVLTILNTRKEQVRRSAYQDLLLYAGKVRDYAVAAIPELSAHQALVMDELFAGRVLAEKLARAVGILDKVIDQTDRRVFKGEQVAASEKVVSFFEDHTDIIVKKRRETEFGHKIFLTGGSSTLILDCLIVRGNPADTEQYAPLLQRQQALYGRMPRQVSVDGGFASQDNLAFAKEHEIKDAVFAKKRGLSVLDMAKSAWVYKKLRNFRAGIEAGISTLKRAFGLDRCTWKGWTGFGRYVWSSIVSYNLLVLARTKLAAA
ncbi:MAG: ISNCY family transposase [Deltaproteobacteria bacterium]|jgi:IS5 family transposase|nr:ISNCY family transposase [Deltaproteobacteria bacterium]MDD3620069.1 ISNCY family transposase [Desulfobulbaceae bacterium]